MAQKKPSSFTSPKKAATASTRQRDALRAQQAAAAKRRTRNRAIIAVVGVVVVALIVTLVVLFANKPPQPVPTTTPPTQTTPGVTATPTASTPPDGNTADLAQAAWITVPNTPKAGAIVVDLHTDYQCPWCGYVEQAYSQALADLSARGDIILRIHTRIFLDYVSDKTIPNSSIRPAIAAACVDMADNTKYIAYHDAVFTNQPASEGAGYSDEQLTVAFPAQAGLTGSALATFQTCYTNKTPLAWIQAVEQNNGQPVLNANPPYTFLYGSDKKAYYDMADPYSPVYWDDPSNGHTQAGMRGTPSMFANGNPFTIGQMFKYGADNKTPVPALGTDADSILAFLKQVAGV